MHLWPLLALIERGGNAQTAITFTEQNDRQFWDRYARLPGDTRQPGTSPNFTQDYYIEPLVQQLKPSDYYHRSPASIRDRTFWRSWRAADFDQATNEWKLKPNWAQIFEEKVLMRSGVAYRVPVLDVAVFLFRNEGFADDADATTLEAKFKDVFKFAPADYARILVFTPENSDNIFTTTKPSDEAMASAIREAVVSDAPQETLPPSDEQPPLLDNDDRHLIDVRKLLALGSSGIIFRGSPGTSKTWYAKQIARKLVADPKKDIFQVQFHPAYGYEDFVEGYRPSQDTKSGFQIVPRIFLAARDRAMKLKTPVVFIIDEINRGDPARVFGELLTYLEHGYRDAEFPSALSGTAMTVPRNLVLIGTMNPHDRSTLQFDIALVRRFDHIDLAPDPEIVEAFLTNTEERPTEFKNEQVTRVVTWFDALQNMLKPVGVGHTYFKDVKTPEQLLTVWKYRMLPYCENVLELDPARLAGVKNSFDKMLKEVMGQPAEAQA